MSSSNTRTLQYASAPRIREPRPTQRSAPMTEHQRAEAKEARNLRQAAINEEVASWFTYTMGKASDLATRFEMDERYFLDLFFGGGAHMVHHHEKTNPYNAFLYFKAAEERGTYPVKKTLGEVQKAHLEEYRTLSAAERDELVEKFDLEKITKTNVQRPTPRSRVQDVSNVLRNIEILLGGLQRRVGIQAMLCIVRDTTKYAMKPQWFFTDPELEPYLPIAVGNHWDTAQVGTQLEAFAIADCKVGSMWLSTKYRVEANTTDV
ncbi:hypothetical protein BDN72DRAFT_781255 [Pluteus cervinus]|uniref:Uncharacterized protein n=1 Tax=Pluteus cervinus TaxID=181527 RepID=A0ACD3A038_9AGAR|nr:hypothetical protein BDN72DRAFT_781255 [Pluteus cervinus]